LPTVRVGTFEDTLVLHFGGEFRRINAYTLAGTLINLTDAAKAANAVLNPGFDIEVVVEGFASGSFKTTIRTIYRSVENLFSNQAVQAIVLNVIASVIYQYTLAPSGGVKVIVETTEVVIEEGDTRIVVPREVHEAAQRVEQNPRFRTGIGQAARTLQEDATVTYFGFSSNLTDTAPDVPIPRDALGRLPASLDGDGDDTRELIETTEVEIVRAILQRSKRRWQFVWNGVQISAPVRDAQFHTDFLAHRITIAPGDSLRVKLRIKQTRHPRAGVFINEAYEVVEVLNHIPRPPQMALSDARRRIRARKSTAKTAAPRVVRRRG
jgi:hypothetical protein